jgi:PAS domain S-box-containing protein
MATGGDDLVIRRLAFDQAPVALSLLDLDGRQVAANDAYLTMFGLERDHISDVTALALTHPSDHERTRDYLGGLSTGDIAEVVTEKLYVRADGSVFQGRLAARPVVDDDGATVAILGVIRDLTEQEVFDRIERQLDAREQVERVAAATAHELNNVLGAIALQLDLDGTTTTESLRALLDRASRLGDQLASMSGDDLRSSPLENVPLADDVPRPAVLVVDDEPSLRDSVAQTLRRSGFEVYVAADGLEALEVARGQRFGVLVTDLVMPNMDGITLAERLREGRPDLPVLFITGHAAVDFARRLPLDAPVLRKPFRALDLVSSVSRLVPAVT